MVRAALVLLTALLSLVAAACDSDPVSNGDPDPDPAEVTVELVAEGLDSPVYLTTPPSDDAPSDDGSESELFVVEQTGRIRIIEPDGTVHPTPFLDLSDRVSCCGERGLLSVAFHPEYRENGHLYVNYTDEEGDTRVERYTVSDDPDVADPSSARLILTVDQPLPNHNGGLNVFGPDGMLYIGLGDGGGSGDGLGHGQNFNTLLGAILRIDVNSGDPYAIPEDNPFAGLDHAQPEVWAYGLRNPWRFSFDGETGDLYIGDVGQGQWEEINRTGPGEGGVNYGWNVMEGTHCYEPSSACDTFGLTLPISEYSHAEGCSVTGGYVYRGAELPQLEGHYFFADYCGGWVRSLSPGGTGDPTVTEWTLGSLGAITSFGEDSAGEIYILTQEGDVLRLVGAD